MGNFFKEAAKCRVEIESWVEIGEIGKAETELSRLRDIYGKSGRARNKNDQADAPLIHAIVKSMEELVNGKKKGM